MTPPNNTADTSAMTMATDIDGARRMADGTCDKAPSTPANCPTMSVQRRMRVAAGLRLMWSGHDRARLALAPPIP